MMDLLGIINYLDIFECPSVQSLIQYKWNTYARMIHYTMFLNNVIYFVFFMLYVNQKFIRIEISQA